MSLYQPSGDRVCFSKDCLVKQDICRFCWTTNAQEYFYIISNDINSSSLNHLVNKVKIVLGIDLLAEDGYKYPNKVCVTCFNKIDNFYEFKMFCQDSNRKLNEMLKSNNDSTFVDAPLQLDNVKLETIEMPGFDENNSNTVDVFIESPQSPINNQIITEPIKPEKPTLNTRYKPKRTKHYCYVCCFNFEKKDLFLKHNSEAHGIEKDGLFKCFGCEKRFKSKKHRVNHESMFCKGLKDGYKCSLCNRFLPKRRIYEAHMRDHRDNKKIDLPEDIFKCKKCSDQFKSKESLMYHMKTHNVEKKKYVCESCGRVFTRQDYLFRHKLTHTGAKPHRCPHCDFRTAQRSSMTVHIRRHTGERPYACAQCPQRCVSASNLRAHARRHAAHAAHTAHTAPRYQCTVCPKQFGYKMSLQEHIQTIHEKSQSHPCPHCGAVYSRTRGLKRHIRAKHTDSTTPNNIIVKKTCKNPQETSDKVEYENTETKTYFIISNAKLSFPALCVTENI